MDFQLYLQTSTEFLANLTTTDMKLTINIDYIRQFTKLQLIDYKNYDQPELSNVKYVMKEKFKTDSSDDGTCKSDMFVDNKKDCDLGAPFYSAESAGDPELNNVCFLTDIFLTNKLNSNHFNIV